MSSERPSFKPKGGLRQVKLVDLLIIVLLIGILVAGGYFRFIGVNWDDSHHLHPDERFLSMVLSSISPVDKAGGYFNTEISSLNPANRGYGFFVYGTLPIFIIRYIGEWLGQTGYDPITILGRQLSAIMDLITVVLVFLIGRRLLSNRVGLIAASLYAFSVLPIQLSHFMTVDTFTNTFGMLTIYLGVWIATNKIPDSVPVEEEIKKASHYLKRWLPYILFGISLGMATASKINAVSLALFLVLVEIVRIIKAEQSQRRTIILRALVNLIIAGVVSFLAFRVFQPYAFEGPGFFNFKISPNWWSSMQSLSAQAAGEVDFPPALQWARRPITFAWTNMVQWGLGLPLGIFSWLSFLGMAWSIFKKRNLHFLPLWAWTGIYFLWQGLSWVRSMRYQMLIYPLMALIAAWALQQLWQQRKGLSCWKIRLKPGLIRSVGIVLTVLIISSTAVWAFAFTRIYSKPHTRVAASDWIYQNIPGPVNLEIKTENGSYNQPLPYRSGVLITKAQPYQLPFKPISDAVLTGITIPHMVDQANLDEPHTVHINIVDISQPDQLLASYELIQLFKAPDSNWQGNPITVLFEQKAALDTNKTYALQVSIEFGDGLILLNGSPQLGLLLADGTQSTQNLPKPNQVFRTAEAYTMDIRAAETGLITSVNMPYLLDLGLDPSVKTLQLTLSMNIEGNVSEYSAFLQDDFADLADGKGASYSFKFDEPFKVTSGQSLGFNLRIIEGNGELTIFTQAPAHESSWDDALPIGNVDYYPYSDNGGIYRGDLNLELYWPDEPSKLARFVSILDQADTIFISSNRQFGTTTRVPERYPLTSAYYRALLGCPVGEDLVTCYNVAKPGDYESQLGFELVSVFESFPTLGNLRFNSQFAEEAFTVYDAPKVLIFAKTSDYDPMVVRSLLSSVDLSKVKQITAKQASDPRYSQSASDDSPQANLMLSDEILAQQRANGTWSQLFDRESLLNASPALGVVAMYLLITVIGWLVYPLMRLALPGLSDKGYALTRILGILLQGYLVWLAGSLGIAYDRLTILIILGLIAIIGLVLYLDNKDVIKKELKENWKYIVLIEVLALIGFLIFLYIRIQNPDLWHPYKGGEKPMDFSYFNAILKSTTFPPYDPWFAGGYINYYYFGLMIVSVPVKLLGIIPATAYNIILPLLFSCVLTAAFSLGWNIYHEIQKSSVEDNEKKRKRFWSGATWSGLTTTFLLLIAGNLGTIRLMVQSMQRLGSGGTLLDDASFIQNINWFLQGFIQFLKKTPLPLYPGDWYWVPSRAIPGEAITEFPFFTFLYADLHAHLIAIPLVLLAISWGLSFLFAKGKWGDGSHKRNIFHPIIGFFIGGLVIGVLKPANTWDYYTFLIFNIVILLYVYWRYHLKRNLETSNNVRQILLKILLPIGALFALTVLLYYPFSHWFGQGYSDVGYWTGDKTPISSYLVHWGVFLFIIISWLVVETLDWMAATRISAIKKMKPYQPYLIFAGIICLILILGLLLTKVSIGLIVVPVGIWVLLLLLRKDIPDGKRAILFMIGTALILTLMVELIYLVGDIGRMNVVFKLYNQAWLLFAIAAGFCTIMMLKAIEKWKTLSQFLWQLVFFSLVISAALFPLLGTMDKINDRMAVDAPNTLDGMAYMQYSTYFDMGVLMDLREDYLAIQWMQDNIKGSPVIVEGQAYEYRWGTRYTIYTGLPGVVGWNWHQRQQRAILQSNVVQERVDDVGKFYLSDDIAEAKDFLKKYNVSYVVLGQLERAFFPGDGLNKFDKFNGILWDAVYSQGDTMIYKVRVLK